MRILYARILRIHVCRYAHIRTYIRVYMSLCYASPQVSLCEALFDKQRTFLEWKSVRLQHQNNLHSVKNVNESLNISSFWLLHKFTDKLPFINNCLIFSCQEVSRRIETVSWFPYITLLFLFIPNITCVMFTLKLTAVNKSLGQRIIILLVVLTLFKRNDCLWLSTGSQLIMKRSTKSKLWNYKIEILCFSHVGNSLVKLKCLSSEALRGPVEKIRTPVLFHKNRALKRQKFSFLA